MIKEDIISMAKQSELGFLLGDNWMLHHELEYFANLVAEHERDKLIDAAMKAAEKGIDTAIALEREACAKIAEIAGPYQSADLIRARSKE
jgi:methanogenic corrinoid protein MtbC1